MKHTDILIFAALLAVPYMLEAQDGRNQTVVVTNKFSFDSSAREKHQLEMAVPDSLNVFEQSFNYSVFDKPYEGAYEFKPYNLNLKPVYGQNVNRQFWLNAGIGYTLFPELDLVYEPVRGERCAFGIFARHRSFAGDYRKLGVDADGLLSQTRNADGQREYWGGWNYDMDNEGGLNFSYDWDRTGLSLTAAYRGLQQRDWLCTRSLDQAVADLKVYSKRPSSKVFNYSAYLSYRFGRDYILSSPGKSELMEHNMSFGFSFMADLKKKGHFALDAGADVAMYTNALSHTALMVEFLPQYVWENGGWYFKAGVRLDIPVTTDRDRLENWNGDKSFSQWVYPDVSLSYEFRNIPLNIYLNVTGGEKLRDYASLVDDYRHFSLLSRYEASAGALEGSFGFTHPVLKNEIERVNAEFGLRGSIRSVFSYNLSVSYAEKASLALESINFANLPLRTGGTAVEVPCYSIAYANAGQLNARAEAEYADDWGAVGLKLLYAGLYLREGAPESCILPAALSGNLDVKFNLIKRLYFGLGCDFATPRQVHMPSGQGFKIPAYGDPYLSVQYLFNNMLSVWFKASRFTGQTIYSAPLYSERGPRLTAGVSLSF